MANAVAKEPTGMNQLIWEATEIKPGGGVKSREDIEVLEKAGVDAVLIGESMMRAEDKKSFLNSLKGLA